MIFDQWRLYIYIYIIAKLSDSRMDPLRFAYRAKRGVEDATLTSFNLMASHLDTSGTTVCVQVMDRSSAFETDLNV